MAKRGEHYIDKKEFLAELIAYKESIRIAHKERKTQAAYS